MMHPSSTRAMPKNDRDEVMLQPESVNSSEQVNDAALLARVVRREEQALGAIYDRYHRLVFAIALRITADRAAAEEVVQDVFQAVWQSALGFRADGSFRSWLIGITRHRAIDMTRSCRYRSWVREETLDQYIGPPLAGSGGQDDTVLLREVVRMALAALPEVQQQVIMLAYYGGLTQVEIAARLGEPVGTIKSRMRSGLLRLRDLLATAEE